MMNSSLPVANRNLTIMSDSTQWPVWPFLPLIRTNADGEVECGLMYDCWEMDQQPGYSATVFLANLFQIPPTQSEFFELPKCVYDTLEELLADGWRID
jgi:hypothetical protein